MINKIYSKKKTKCILLIQLFLIFNLILIISFQNDVFNRDYSNKNSDYVIYDPPSNIQTSSSGPPDRYYFKYYKMITIDHNKVSGTGNLTDFPLLISILDSDLHNEAQSNGNDIAFAYNTTWLDHELELFNQNYNSTHAQLIAWVRIPSLHSSIDTNITMYYGNSTIGPQENPEGVWDNSYEGVWHLKEDPGTGYPGDIKDSTINSNDGTAISMGSTDQETGKIDGCYDFDGNDDPDYVSIGNVGLGINTLEFWLNPTTLSGYKSYNTGYKSPTATGAYYNAWTNPTGAYISNDYSKASEQTYGDDQDWYNFGFNIPTNAIIVGILVSIEGSTSQYGYSQGCRARLSWNGGSSYTSYKTQSWTSTYDSYKSIGGSTDAWGRSWSPSDFNNGNFRIWLEKTGSSYYSLLVDHIRIDVYYSLPVDMVVIDLDGIDQISIDHTSGDIKAINFPGLTTTYINGEVGSTVTAGNWYHVVITDTTGFDASDLDFARNASDYFEGKLDEIRLSNSVRSLNWISTEFSNQYDPNSFYIISQGDLVDKEPPNYSNLTEIVDPLELGDNMIIRINVTDPSGISQVILEYEEEGTPKNHSMTYISGDMWEYDLWTPDSVGIKSYTIWMNDTMNNWNSTTGSINVIDTIAPTYSDLIESADPLQLGDNETITIKAYDSPGSGINQLLLEYEEDGTPKNHTMNSLGGNTWSWSNWKPDSSGLYSYRIFIEDLQNNWNVTNIYTLRVINSTAPLIANLSESADPLELGNYLTIAIDVFDELTNVSSVLIKLDNINYTMTYIANNSYEINTYEINWTRNLIGIVIYTIYANDSENNWNSLTSSFDIVDTTKPTFTAFNVSNELLELGETVTISINATDLAGIEQARIIYGGFNYKMEDNGPNNWDFFWGNWVPQNSGTHPYTISIEDKNHNWNFINGEINVQDTIAPAFFNLTESDDPVELGESVIITIIVSDLSDLKRVLIEYESSNHSMANIGGDLWQHYGWRPELANNYSYTIYMEDNSNNYNFTTGSIQFQDTISPVYSNLVKNADPLELGDTAIIRINIDDIGGIDNALIEFDGTNHTMTNLYGNVWQYDSWVPESWIVYQYMIYMEDRSGNSNFMIDNITVQDTIAPVAPFITNAPSGDVSGILTFDWLDGEDPSGISYYLLIIDNETNPDITPGFLYCFNISNVGSESSFFELTESLVQGKYYYFLYQIDGVGHQSEYTMGTFSIVLVGDPILMNFIIIVAILASLVAIGSTIIIARKRVKKEIEPPREKIPLKVVLSHITKISTLESASTKKNVEKKKDKKKSGKSNNMSFTVNEEMLKTRIDRIRAFGNELLAEGAYLEAQKQFEFAEKVLIRMGRKEEALEFSNLKITIKELAEEREKKLEQLELEKLGDNSLVVFELYNDVIELSHRLKDVDVADIYQSELIEEFQSNEQKLKDLEYQRFKLYQQANSLMIDKMFEKAVESYEHCKKISQFLVKLGRVNENKNIEKFDNLINDCLKKASQLNDNGSES